MNNKERLLNEMMADLRRADMRAVLYLEGTTDIPIFFGLLGVSLPTGSDKIGYFHEGCLVKPISGAYTVRDRVELAQATPGFKGHVFGMLDGDGRPLGELRQAFDRGPLFTWQAYCIENLLIKAGWPASWGPQPAWQDELLRYGPYIGLNKLWIELQGTLTSLQLRGYARPDHSMPLKTTEEVHAALLRDKDLLMNYDVARRFREEVDAFCATVQRDLDEAHALLNGKWLVSRLAVERRISTQECATQWAQAIAQTGGLPEVRDLWGRILKSAGRA